MANDQFQTLHHQLRNKTSTIQLKVRTRFYATITKNQSQKSFRNQLNFHEPIKTESSNHII